MPFASEHSEQWTQSDWDQAIEDGTLRIRQQVVIVAGGHNYEGVSLGSIRIFHNWEDAEAYRLRMITPSRPGAQPSYDWMEIVEDYVR